MQLRKCCNHLFLLKGVWDEICKDVYHDDNAYLDKLLESSGKLILLDKFIEKFRQEKSKILIFSQFKHMLDIIEEYARLKKI